MNRKITRQEFNQIIKQKEYNSVIKRKLKKLYELNSENPKKINDNLTKIACNLEMIMTAYENLKSNQYALTEGTDPKDTVDRFDLKLINKISSNIRNGTYKWKDIKQIEIPKPGKKKKRPLGLPNFSDKITQEIIRIILNVIYEPIFQIIELNHGFRPKRGTHTAVNSLKSCGQGMEIALEGDIKGAFPNINPKILMNILKKKISDKKFLKLIETSLKHFIVFKGKSVQNVIGTPQGSIASPILFNIYMHEFDLKIIEVLKRKEKENELENRKTNVRPRNYATTTARIFRRRKILERISESKPFCKLTYCLLRNKIRKDKKIQVTLSSVYKPKRKKRICYCRYVDDWILLSNEKISDIEKLKIELTDWLQKHLNLKLDLEKTSITNLYKKKAKFLGFTFSNHIKKITRKRYNDQKFIEKEKAKTFKVRTNSLLFIGIDHERVKSRMVNKKIITKKKHHTRHLPLYNHLKPWEIVNKFKQKLEGLLNYYYPHLSYSSDLSFYYYALKYSCLKTLSNQKKISIAQLQKIYSPKIRIKGAKKIMKRGEIVEENFESYFPTYLEIMNKIGTRTSLERKNNKRAAKDELNSPITTEDLIEFQTNKNLSDPFNRS